ncbi:MAG TPA: deoxyribodipyrimidine photo-lyase [Novimethylophilus sp.]|jgi:deoxyribodipyrimidine photo-lyase|uniref:cryptochrome/photolyase family protein n=1 Tax=Novimethylophilus sp. TaxID=2137426 RepID=UPI002F41A8D2
MQDKPYDKALVWFRRDLRDYDHAALSRALTQSRHVYCVFVFDTDILGTLKDKADRRVEFIWESVRELKTALRDRGGDLIVPHGSAAREIPMLARSLGVQAVFANRDYEPQALARDAAVADALAADGVAFLTFKDQVIFEGDEVLTGDGRPYRVFTFYKKAWLKKVTGNDLVPHPVDEHLAALAAPARPSLLPTLEALGFSRNHLDGLLPTGMSGADRLFEDFQERIDNYHAVRDFPALKGPSYLSVHLRFGTLSIRAVVSHAWYMGSSGAEVWLNELIWREFYFMVLHYHPQVAEGHAYKPEFEHFSFPGSNEYFLAWCEGRTGYPLVDAAMRQLNRTGYMHNRLRMVTAGFLVKDLLVDWRRGEAYFADRLVDFDLAANNGGWQWAASTGCDAQPWFRVFNPVTQSEKFDAEGKFIRRYVPELAPCDNREIHAPWKMAPQRQAQIGVVIGRDYPAPIVDHAVMRAKVLALYKSAGR